MTTQEKAEANILKRSQRTIARIDKEIDNLSKAQDKARCGSPESHLLTTAIHDLYEAKSNLEIVVSRITDKQKGIYL